MNASIKYVLKEDKIDARGECPLYLRVTYNRKLARLGLNIKLKPSDWNSEKEEVRRSHSRYKVLNHELLKIRTKAQDAILELKELNKLDAKRVVQILKGQDNKDFVSYCEKYISIIEKNGQVRLAKNTKVLLNKLKDYTNSESFNFATIDKEFIEGFVNHMKTVYENKNNTIRKNLQFLGTVIQSAKRDGYMNSNPLTDYKLPVYQKPKKEALTIEQIERIVNLDLQKDSSLWHTRNYFLFSFYNAGIRFGDLCKLKVKDIQDGRLKYLMSKSTSNSEPKWKNIKLNNQAIEILNFYDYDVKKSDEYIFPILDSDVSESKPLEFDRAKQSKTAIANKNLKKIAEMAEIEQNLSTHIARHSFANYALKNGVSIYSISKALAHSDLKTTETYLKSFDEELLDNEMEELFS